MMRTLFLPVLVVLCCWTAVSPASELEPVLFVTGEVRQNGDLADLQAEAARRMKEAAKDLERATASGNEGDRLQAARDLEQAASSADALARAVAEAHRQVDNFGAVLANTIKKELSCARVLREHELAVFFERQRELAIDRAGTDLDPLDPANSEIPEAEYQVKITGTIPLEHGTAGPLALTASCTHKKTSTVLASVATAQGGGDSLAGLADTFVGQMARFEICPYLGKVSVSVDLTTDREEHTERQVYCKRQDGRFVRTASIHRTSKQRWELEKTGRRAAGGDVEATGLEKDHETEIDDCYRCSSGGEASRTLTKKTTKEFTLSGLSAESGGKQGETVNKDARIRIRFVDNGYYLLKIDAVSQNGTEMADLFERATGTCDPIDRDPPPKPGKRDVHLTGEWGPFRGTPTDKRLADSQDEPLNNPAIGETGKRTIRFDLHRK